MFEVKIDQENRHYLHIYPSTIHIWRETLHYNIDNLPYLTPRNEAIASFSYIKKQIIQNIHHYNGYIKY